MRTKPSLEASSVRSRLTVQHQISFAEQQQAQHLTCLCGKEPINSRAMDAASATSALPPGGPSGLSQVMSPSAQQTMVASTLMASGMPQAYGATAGPSAQGNPGGVELSGSQRVVVAPPAGTGMSSDEYALQLPQPCVAPSSREEGQPIVLQQQPTWNPHAESPLLGSGTLQRKPDLEARRMPPGGQQHSMARWVSRLTDFLRTTASRGAGGVDRWLGDFSGSSAPFGGFSPGRAAAPHGEAPAVFVGNQQTMIAFSPPEELQMRGLAIPPTWEQTPELQDRPLFSEEQLQRMERSTAQTSLLLAPPLRDHPRLPSEEASSGSSQARAVRLQLEMYDRRQREELQRLQQQIFDLRAERELLTTQVTRRQEVPHGVRASGTTEVPHGVRASDIAEVPHGVRASGTTEVPHGVRASDTAEVPHGVRAVGTAEVPHGVRASGTTEVPHGVRAVGTTEVPHGVRASGTTEVPHGVRAVGTAEVPHGVRAVGTAEVPHGVRASGTTEVPHGVRAVGTTEVPHGVRAVGTAEVPHGVRASDIAEVPHGVRASGTAEVPHGVRASGTTEVPHGVRAVGTTEVPHVASPVGQVDAQVGRHQSGETGSDGAC